MAVMACVTIGMGLLLAACALWLLLSLVGLPILTDRLYAPVHSCELPVGVPHIPQQGTQLLASLYCAGRALKQLHS
jgi:hypothetical protein